MAGRCIPPSGGILLTNLLKVKDYLIMFAYHRSMTKGHLPKSIRILVLVTLMLFGFVNTTQPSRASGITTQLFITEVQVSDSEFIELYNPNDQVISLSGWQVKYRGSGASETSLKTFASTDTLPSHGFLLLSHGFTVPSGVTSVTFTASLANTAGYVILYDQSGTAADLVGWGSTTQNMQGVAAVAPSSGRSIQRCFLNGSLALSSPHDNSAEFLAYSQVTPGGGVACIIPEPLDVCPNIDGAQAEIPVGYEQNQAGDCIVPAVCLLEISEVSAQPNYNGQEYVELYNSGKVTADTSLCVLRINSTTNKNITVAQIAPGQRLIQPFPSGTIRNSTGQVVLVNSNNEAIIYSYPETLTGQTSNFESGSQTGVVSDKATPGEPNELVIFSEEELAVATGETVLAPCPAGKYRNPETNRCRNLESSITALAACQTGQERNPETNRCKKVDTSTLTPCKEGQERNPETNRCRKVGNEDGLTPCQIGQERNPETNRCRKIATTANNALAAVSNTAAISQVKSGFKIVAVLAVVVVGYGLYEYRIDIKNFYSRVRGNPRKGRPPG